MSTKIEGGAGMELSPQQKQQLDSLPVIRDPEDFLLTQEALRVGKLEVSPNLDLLKFLITLPTETALVYHTPHWFIVRGNRQGVLYPYEVFADKADITLHSHPSYADVKNDFIPSSEDLISSHLFGRNFIVSSKGVTQYYPLRDFETWSKLRWWEWNVGSGIEDHISFLLSLGARYTLNPFEELNNEKLSTLFYGNK